MQYLIKSIYLLLILCLVTGCKSSGIIGGGPVTDKSAVKSGKGFAYYLGKDIAIVNVKKTTTIKRSFDENLKIEESKNEEYVVETEFETIPDLSQYYFLDVKPGKLNKSELKIELRENGLLKTVGGGSTGQGREVVKGVVGFLANLAGATLVIPSIEIEEKNDTECKPGEAPFVNLPRSSRALISSNLNVCNTYQQIESIRKSLHAKQNTQLKLESALLAASEKTLARLQQKLNVVKESVKSLEKQLSLVQTEFRLSLERFIAEKQIGVRQEVESYREVFALEELPVLGSFVHDQTNGDMVGQIKASMNCKSTKKKACDFFDKTNVFVELSRPQNMVVHDENPIHTGKEKMKEARVFYRNTVPVQVRTNVLDAGKASRWKLQSSNHEIVYVLHPEAKPRFFELKPRAFAGGKVSVSFDEKGRPFSLERSETASASELSRALFESAVLAQDEVANSLAKTSEIQGSLREIRFNNLVTEIAQLKKEKEKADAQLSLEGTTANYDLVLKQQAMSAQLESIQAELALDSAVKMGEQKAELELLKLELERVKTMLELMQIQQADNN